MTETGDLKGQEPRSRQPGAEDAGIRRVVILLDASRRSMAALDAAAIFARASGAELVGWFVEEEELMRCAGYPWVREVSLSGAATPMQPGEVEQRLRNRAEAVRSALQRVARTQGLRTRLHIHRGRVVQKVLELSTRDDFLILGKIGYRGALGLRVGSTARALVGSAPGRVMMYEQPARSVSPSVIAVVVTPGEEGLRALATSVALAVNNGASLAVLVATDNESGRDRQRENTIRTLLRDANSHIRVLTVREVTTNNVLQVLGAESAESLVVPRQWALQAQRRRVDLVEEALMPVVVVP